MHSAARYLRLWLAFARYGLLRELTFRTNFVVKIAVEILWLTLLLVFYRTVFQQTSVVASWNEDEYLFFVGCYFALGGVIETLFLENCNEFADLVRTGDLDFYLLRPIDEQFLVTCRHIDWSTSANVLMGAGVMIAALWDMGWEFHAGQVVLFLLLFTCGTALAYGFLLLLTSASVWFMRNQSLYEMWWLFTTLMRYPRQIFTEQSWAAPVGWFLSYVIPIMLVISVPAELMAKKIVDKTFVACLSIATIIMLVASRWFFRLALRRYRSASS